MGAPSITASQNLDGFHVARALCQVVHRPGDKTRRGLAHWRQTTVMLVDVSIVHTQEGIAIGATPTLVGRKIKEPFLACHAHVRRTQLGTTNPTLHFNWLHERSETARPSCCTVGIIVKLVAMGHGVCFALVGCVFFGISRIVKGSAFVRLLGKIRWAHSDRFRRFF